jgi:hypothetical protein
LKKDAMAAFESPLHDTRKTRQTFEPSIWLILLLLLLLVGKVIATVYFSDRTFDFTDGGCYMLWYAHPDKDPHPFYYFHKIILGLTPFIDWNIISLRWLKMVSEVLVILAMSFAVYQNVKEFVAKGAKTFLFIFSFIGLGYFSTWFSWIFYESDMTYLLAVLSISLVFGTINTQRKGLFPAALLVAGAITGIQFFNKFSTSFFLFVATLIIVQLVRKGWKNHVAYLVGIAIGVGAFFLITGYKPAIWWQEYLDGYKYLIEPLGYHPLRLIWMYMLILWPLPLIALTPIVVHYSMSKLFAFIRVKIAPPALFAGSLLFILVLFYYTFPTRYLNLDNPAVSKLYFYWYFPLLSFLLFLGFEYIQFKGFSKQQWLLAIIWFILPAIVFVGTSTPATLSLASFLVPWYGLLCFYIVRHYTPEFNYGIAVIAFVSCFVFFVNHIQRPYWTNKPMYYPRVEVQGPNETILLDTVTAQFIVSTKEILNKAEIEPGYPIVALHDIPGLIYLVGGYSPATPWYFNVLDARQSDLKNMMKEFNCLHISRIKLFEERQPVFMINQLSFYGTLPCITEHGFDLYEDYELPQKVSNPTIRNQIARFSKGSSDTLLIFIPKRPFTQTHLN